MKECITCKEVKSLDDFALSRRVKLDGTRSPMRECRVCWRSKVNARRRESVPKYNRKYKYGLEEEQFQALVSKFDGKCWACKKEHPVMCIDHDHACCDREGSCGKCVRGYLCSPCNRAIGALNDDVNALIGLISYLRPNGVESRES